MKIVNSLAAALLLLTPVQGTLRGIDTVDGLYDDKAEAPKVAEAQAIEKSPEVRKVAVK